MIHEDRAGAALADAATEFRASQRKVGAQDPEQGPIRSHTDPRRLPVEAK
jgi:hypothetical protein